MNSKSLIKDENYDLTYQMLMDEIELYKKKYHLSQEEITLKERIIVRLYNELNSLKDQLNLMLSNHDKAKIEFEQTKIQLEEDKRQLLCIYENTLDKIDELKNENSILLQSKKALLISIDHLKQSNLDLKIRLSDLTIELHLLRENNQENLNRTQPDLSNFLILLSEYETIINRLIDEFETQKVKIESNLNDLKKLKKYKSLLKKKNVELIELKKKLDLNEANEEKCA